MKVMIVIVLLLVIVAACSAPVKEQSADIPVVIGIQENSSLKIPEEIASTAVIDDGLSLGVLKAGEERSGNIVFKIPIQEDNEVGFSILTGEDRISCYGGLFASELAKGRTVGLNLSSSQIGNFYIGLLMADYSTTEGELGKTITANNIGWTIKVNSVDYGTSQYTDDIDYVKINLELTNTGRFSKFPSWTLSYEVYGIGYVSIDKAGESYYSGSNGLNLEKTSAEADPFKLILIKPNETEKGVVVIDYSLAGYSIYKEDYANLENCYVFVKDAEYKGIAKVNVPCPQ